MAESRKVFGSLIVLGMVLSTFTAAVSVVATSLTPKLIPHISLATPENWWNSSWQYRKPITITNSGSTQTDYQMLFTVDTASLVSAGKMRSDAGDLRFTDSGSTSLSYWIESGVNTSTTKVWVKVSSVLAGSSTIYMYYGNSSATSVSSSDSTFLLYDDFSGTSLNTTRWSSSGSYTIADGALKYNISTPVEYRVYSNSTFQKPVIIETRLKIVSYQHSEFAYAWGYGTQVTNKLTGEGYLAWANDTGFQLGVYGGGTVVVSDSGNVGSWRDYRMEVRVNEMYFSATNPTSSGTNSGISPASSASVFLSGWAGEVWYDWVRARKYASPEPAYSFGSEESTNNPPTASFIYSPTSPTASDTIQFTDQSTDNDGTIASWSWSFGDVATSTLQNPTHQYSAGTYTATLTVTDNGGATNSTSQSITVSAPVAPGKTPTTLSISPSSFTLQSGQSQALTATLKDNNNNALANKTISWSATAGSLSATSGTSNSSGQVTITYTAPTVTAQTSVTITASFAEDASYQLSSGTSTGTITEVILPSTTLSISPSSFTMTSGASTTLTATLTSGGSLVVGKTITWSTTAGTLSPSSGTTNSSGQVTVTYTAPTVTAQTSASITASFAGDASYQSSSVGSSGTIVVPPSATLSISPNSFTLSSGGSTALTATLTSNGSPVAGKTISWSATSGTLSPSSATTNSSGQATVIYTAPTVTAQTSVTVTASFAGTASYQSSSGASIGTINPTEARETILSISPPIFSLYPGYSGQVQSLTATLRDGNYNPLKNKTITWSATSGSVSPSSGTTDALGQGTVTYAAPAITTETPQVTITASFAGDDQHDSSTGASSGTPAVPVRENIPASTGGTIVINVIQINVTVNVLVVRPNALTEDTTLTVSELPPENIPDYAMLSEIFDLGPSGTTFTTPSTLTLPYNENELPEGVDEDDLAVYRRTGLGKSWEKVVGNMQVDKAANTVSVEIDHLSEYAVMAALPTLPTPAAIPIWVIVAAVIALVIGINVVLWRHLREARGDATSVLIEHGLPDMRIAEVEVVREIRNMGEFTIPDLIQKTGASNILVWRTIQKLIEKGLVQPTEEVKPPATGRGKPSTVYKYVGD